MPENVDPQQPPAREVGVTRVTATKPRPGLYEFSLMDLIFLKKFECIALFFHYDIRVQDLEAALRLLLDEYFECLARMTSHADQLHQMSVTEDSWIPLIEQTTQMSATTAIQQYGRTTAQADLLPAYMNVPFFLHGVFAESALDGEEPLFKVTLTHYSDGECSVGFTLSNVIADIQRFYDMLTDLGSIMRGEIEKVPPRNHDRTIFWPDSVVRHFNFQNLFIGADKLPRVYPPDSDMFSFESRHYPNETLQSECLFFPNDVLDKTLERMLVATKDVALTRRQLVLTLMWLLQCEMAAEEGQSVAEWFRKPCWMVSDLMEGENPCLTPSNYFGNAVLPAACNYEQLTDAFKDDVYMNILINACLKINQTWNEGQEPDVVAQRCIGPYKILANMNILSNIPLRTMSLSWHFESRRPDDCAFGRDPPFFVYVPPPYPVFHYTSCFFSDLYHEGTFATVLVVGGRTSRFINSQVLKHCVPGTRHIFGHDGDPFL